MDINSLSPALLWRHFADICAIPHPSHQEEALIAHIQNWAHNLGLHSEQDKAGNLLIKKPATHGMDNCPTVALQAHVDMVPEKADDSDHDFSKDPILPYIDGEWVRAQNTTLGADNGIGLASILAVLESDIAHPPLEALITRTEEVGMVGAINLAPNWLSAKMMINTDTEESGEIYIGCAGGIDADIRLPFARTSVPTSAYKVELVGLAGGHSGMDIDSAKGNAIKLLARILDMANRDVYDNTKNATQGLQIIDFGGGKSRNAIPRGASAIIANIDSARLQQAFETVRQEYVADTQMALQIAKIGNSHQALSASDSQKLLNFVNALPNGVMRQHPSLDVVDSSLSLGKAHLGDVLQLTILVRALDDTPKRYICQQILALCDMVGASVRFGSNYSGWAPDTNSAITAIAKNCYHNILGAPPRIKVIHAGLECGIIKGHYPDMDIVSIGPTIKEPHSPNERVHIAAVAEYWQLLCQILANIDPAPSSVV